MSTPPLPLPGAGARVAVVIPIFNRRNIVIDALETVAAQTRPPYRLVVVDDGSTDGSAEAVADWGRRVNPPFELVIVRQMNTGIAGARNRGAREAPDADYISFLDSDDLWPPDLLERLVKAMEAEPRSVAATADILEIQGPRRTMHSYARLRGNACASLFVDGPAPTSPTLYRGSAYRGSPGFEVASEGFEDWHFDLRVSLMGTWLSVAGEPMIRRWVASERGDAPQISQAQRSPQSLWGEWRMLRRFLRRQGGAAVIPQALQRKRLARSMYRIGRALAVSDPARAAVCYHRAIVLDRTLLRARRRLLTARVRQALMRFTGGGPRPLPAR